MKLAIETYEQEKRAQSVRLTNQFPFLALPFLIILTAFLVSGCGAVTRSIHLPPVSETSSGMIQDGRFVWLDLLTEDTVAAASFYSRLFGWRAAKSDEDEEYYLFYLEGKPIAGMAATQNKDAAAPESLWLATISVSDVDKSLAAVKAQGGQVLEGPLDAAGRDYYRDRVIVVPDREPELEATPLPSGPDDMPDMGAPDFGGDFGGDMGGDW